MLNLNLNPISDFRETDSSFWCTSSTTILLRIAGERKLKNSFSIENSFSIPFPDVAEALMDLKPFLSIRGDGSFYLLHSFYGTSQIVIGHVIRSKSPKLETPGLQFAGLQGLGGFPDH